MPKLGFYSIGESNVICDQCGRAFKSNQLKKRWDNAWTCNMCWEPRHPQDFVRGIKDNQAPALDRPRAAMPQYYADFPSGLTNYAELPNDTTIIIANQVDIRVKVASANWTANPLHQVFIEKGSSVNSTSKEFSFSIFDGANLLLNWAQSSASISSAFSSTFPSLTNGVAYWLRATLDKSTGNASTVKFYTSTDYNPSGRSGSWSQVGSTQTGVPTSYSAIGNNPVTLKKSLGVGPTGNFVGKIYYAEVLSSIDGPTVYSFDANNAINDTMVSSPNGIWNLYNGATMVEI